MFLMMWECLCFEAAGYGAAPVRLPRPSPRTAAQMPPDQQLARWQPPMLLRASADEASILPSSTDSQQITSPPSSGWVCIGACMQACLSLDGGVSKLLPHEEVPAVAGNLQRRRRLLPTSTTELITDITADMQDGAQLSMLPHMTNTSSLPHCITAAQPVTCVHGRAAPSAGQQ